MVDNFKFIYKILKTLEAAMDCPEFELSQIRLDVSPERKEHYFNMLEDEGYIKDGKITLKGLEYVTYNPIMQKQRQISTSIKIIEN